MHLIPTNIQNLCISLNTNQETTKWALEYQLLTRMLVKENALILNPKHLELDLDILEKIKNIIWG